MGDRPRFASALVITAQGRGVKGLGRHHAEYRYKQ